ncbi:MAG: addiction module protein [Chloroflexi bacterium]|nr:addiction module protein [Chloroflexota bacterium]
MMTPTLDSILQLSIAERIQLVEDIWDSIVAAPDRIPITQAQRAELDRRLQEHRLHPETSVS